MPQEESPRITKWLHQNQPTLSEAKLLSVLAPKHIEALSNWLKEKSERVPDEMEHDASGWLQLLARRLDLLNAAIEESKQKQPTDLFQEMTEFAKLVEQAHRECGVPLDAEKTPAQEERIRKKLEELQRER